MTAGSYFVTLIMRFFYETVLEYIYMEGFTMDYTLIILSLNIVIVILLLILVFGRKNNTETEQKLTELQILLETKNKTDSLDKAAARQEQSEQGRWLREELSNNFLRLNEILVQQMNTQNQAQNEKIEKLSSHMAELLANNAAQQEKINENVTKGLKQIQDSNEQKLEAMRQVVDEKLNTTLSRRLDESFKNVSEQLQQLYKSLGEMQTLSSGVQNLNRILTNVKTRGTWGEVQLGALLEQIMAPEQYEQCVAVKRGSKERVDFAVKLPGRDETTGNIWLPIDAKFTQEDYLRLVEAADAADSVAANEALKALEARVKFDARSIRDKYINPPTTTDFAIMFLPTEGLYAEVLRIDGLAEYCQNQCRIMIAGPTTLAALLNSLRVGFATLAIEKKSSEVWKILGAIKKQYSIFNQLIDKSLHKLEDAQQNMTTARDRSRMIYNRLSKVEEIDMPDARAILELPEEE